MLTSLTLTDYRGFEIFEMPHLARVNLIGGVNNAGKTAILEAIYLSLGDQEQVARLPQLFRAASTIDDQRYFWRWLPADGNEDEIVITQFQTEQLGEVTNLWSENQIFEFNGKRFADGFQCGGRSLYRQIGNPDFDGNWPGVEAFAPRPTSPVEDAQIYIRAVKRSPDGEEKIEELLRLIEPRLKRIRAYPDEKTNKPLIHVSLNSGKALPATQLGQGFNRLLRIYCAMLEADAKVFLIDEVETGLHHSVLPVIWKGLAAVARQQDVQIFATTHSREAILTAHRIFCEEPTYDFAYHRLERLNEVITSVTYDRDRLEGADERNFEVR